MVKDKSEAVPIYLPLLSTISSEEETVYQMALKNYQSGDFLAAHQVFATLHRSYEQPLYATYIQRRTNWIKESPPTEMESIVFKQNSANNIRRREGSRTKTLSFYSLFDTSLVEERFFLPFLFMNS